jgi:hypothetical protein
VTACGRRLRVNRVTQRSQVNNDAEELFLETTPSVSRFHDYEAGNPPECPALSTSVVDMNCVFPYAGAEARDSEKMLLVSEQEVGIT